MLFWLGQVIGVQELGLTLIMSLIDLPDSMKRAMARQAEAEREKRAKIIAAEGESLAADQLGAASDVMMAHPLALQPRNLQSLVEVGVDKNTTVVFSAPLMSTIEELGGFLARGAAAVTTPAPPQPSGAPTVQTPAVGGPKALTERPPLVDFDKPVGPAFWDRSKR